MASTPYMKLYIGDYLADTQHLSCLEHGAYLLLIMAYWQHGSPLENNPKLLRRLTRTDPKTFQKVSENVLKMFQVRDGFLFHKRIQKELDKRTEVSEHNRISANVRWCERNANASKTQCERNAIPIVHSPKKKDNMPADAGFDTFWERYPRKADKSKARKAYLARIRAGKKPEDILAALEVYRSRLEHDGTEEKFIKYGASFLNCLDDFEAATSPTEPATPMPVCPICGTTGERAREWRCKVCGFLLEPDLMADDEIVEQFKAEWEAREAVHA
jgi:uncharacterized protein YdaU (DUF1376 family)/rubredoxin